MQPFIAGEKVKEAYRRYIETSFPLRRPELRAQFARLVDEEKLLWQEPFLSLARPFAPGGSFADLIAAGRLDPRIRAAHWGFEALFAHQAAAAARLSTLGTPQNTLVATGTSATVVEPEDAAGRRQLLTFASDLFAEPFGDDAIVWEAYQDIAWPAAPLTPPPALTDADLADINPEDPAHIHRLAQQTLGVTLPDAGEAVFEALYPHTLTHRAFAELEARLASPRALSAVVADFGQLPGRAGLDEAALRREVTALLLLGSAVILTDGRAYHANHPLTVIEDLDRRNALTLSGQSLLEFTYYEVTQQPAAVVAVVKAALAGGTGPRALVAGTPELSAAAQVWGAALQQRQPHFQAGARLDLGDGDALDAVAADPERGVAVILVDVPRWVRDPGAWQRDLAQHNRARLRGWQLIRLPSLWLGTTEGETLLGEIAQSAHDGGARSAGGSTGRASTAAGTELRWVGK